MFIGKFGKLAKCPNYIFMWFYRGVRIFNSTLHEIKATKGIWLMYICKSAKCSKYLFYMFLKSCPDIHLFNRILHERNTIKTFRKSCQFCPQCERRRSEEENVRSSKTVTSCDMRWIAVHVPHAIPHLLCYRAVRRPENSRGGG